MPAKILLTPFWLVAATLVGLGDTLYLSYYHLLGLVPGCAIGGCEIVLGSVYSHPFGVPFAYIGLVYYIYMLFQYFVIHALCMYCAISALTTLALFVIAVRHWHSTSPHPLVQPPQ